MEFSIAQCFLPVSLPKEWLDQQKGQMHLSDPASGLCWIFPGFFKGMTFRYLSVCCRSFPRSAEFFVLHLSSYQNWFFAEFSLTDCICAFFERSLNS